MSSSVSLPATGFDRFELHEALVRGIRAIGFENPWPIQLETISAGRAGRDVLGLAQTGTGKTAAFALPLLDRILKVRRKGPRAIVLAPTRELATQIAAEIRTLSRFTRLQTVTVYGGVSIRQQVSSLRRHPEIIVGCPGRVLDLLGQRVLHLGQIETLVLDEADHMFDMGFLPDIRKILSVLPERRQNLLFSATMPREVRRLAADLLTEPHVVDLAGRAPVATVNHGLHMIAEGRKGDLLEHLLTGADCDSAIVFTRTKHRTRKLAEQLSRDGHRAVGIQGSMSQSQRDRAMNGFRARRFNILVATDLVARGIDVSGVSHVINFDVPSTSEAYIHRIGRTGRAEREGIACTFVTGNDRDWVLATERMIGAPIMRREVPGFEPNAADRSERPRRPFGKNVRGMRSGSGSWSRKGQLGRPRARPKTDSVEGSRSDPLMRIAVQPVLLRLRMDEIRATGGAALGLGSTRCRGSAGCRHIGVKPGDVVE